MQVNITSHFILALELLPLLRASPSARIVVQSSGARYFSKIEKVGDIDGADQGNFDAFDQYTMSKAACAVFVQVLAQKMAAAGITNVMSLVVDPGLASTGVNIQHDLAKSLHLAEGAGMDIDTNQMHDAMGHHAADGALPMAMASIDPAASSGDWYTTDGTEKSTTLANFGHKMEPQKVEKDAFVDPCKDPLCGWSVNAKEAIWQQLESMTGMTWAAAVDCRLADRADISTADRYLQEVVSPTLKPLLRQLVEARPADARIFMLNALRQLQQQRRQE